MKKTLCLLAAMSAVLAGCSQTKAPPAAGTVGNQEISPELFDYYASKQTRVAADQIPQARKDVLLVELHKLAAAAQAEASHVSADTRHELDLQRMQTLAHAGAVAAGVFATPSDADLRTAYEQFKSKLPASEYHVAHILVATEGLAELVIVRLQAGEAFAKVAQEKSADDSKSRGGDIGWIAPGKLPVDFTDALATLKVGGVSTKPVHTIYGWHVIKLLETRAANPPPFEQVKAQLAVNLQQDRYQAFLDQSLKSVTSN